MEGSELDELAWEAHPIRNKKYKWHLVNVPTDPNHLGRGTEYWSLLFRCDRYTIHCFSGVTNFEILIGLSHLLILPSLVKNGLEYQLNSEIC